MYRIGVDLGGTNIVAGVVDEFYKIVGKGKRKTACPRPAKEILADIAVCVNEAVKDAGITMDEVSSIGIGTPGSVNKRLGIIEYANNLGFDKVPARDILSKYFDQPIYLENDANCAALGEAVAGAEVLKLTRQMTEVARSFDDEEFDEEEMEQISEAIDKTYFAPLEAVFNGIIDRIAEPRINIKVDSQDHLIRD